jgi:hypothetical protein
MKRLLVCTALAALPFLAALPLTAQEKKPAPAKPDRAAEARAALNKAKQDARNKERLKDAEAAIKKALKNSEAAKEEIDRMKTKDDVPDGKDAKATIERLKNSVDKNDLKEFETLLKESTEAMKEEIKAYQEKRRQEGKTTLAPVAPSPASEPPPVSFDNVPAPAPMPLTKAPVFPAGPPVKAQHMIKGPARDPRNPDKVLPDSDPRTRTWVLTGKVHIRRPFMALDADEVDLLLYEGEQAGLSGGETKSAPSADPIGRPKREGGPFERIVARGNVRVMFVDRNGMVKVGRGGSMIYEEKSGIFLIKEWPEAELGDKLLRGSSKDSVIKLSDLKSEDPAVDMAGLEAFTMERRLSADELPRTWEKEVPAAGPVKPKAGAAPSPAPR